MTRADSHKARQLLLELETLFDTGEELRNPGDQMAVYSSITTLIAIAKEEAEEEQSL